jgi:hypothetical protein
MVRHDRSLLGTIVVRVLHMIDSQIVKDAYTNDVEQQNTTRFCDIGYLDGVEPEHNRFTSTKHSSKDADIVRELLWRIGERTDPVVDDVVPELREDPVEHEEYKDPTESRFVPVRGYGRWIVAVVVACADLFLSIHGR